MQETITKEEARQYYLDKARRCHELEEKALKDHDLETSWSFFNEAKKYEAKANDPDVLNIYIWDPMVYWDKWWEL